jgi:hypothetical protein
VYVFDNAIAITALCLCAVGVAPHTATRPKLFCLAFRLLYAQELGIPISLSGGGAPGESGPAETGVPAVRGSYFTVYSMNIPTLYIRAHTLG